MAWVQGPAAVSAGAAASNAATFGSSTPAGNLVVVVVTQIANPSVRAITNIRDNVDAGVDYSLAKSRTTAHATPLKIDIYYKVATGAGTRTVTVSFSGGTTDSTIAVDEYDSTYTALDATNSNEGTGTSATPGSATASATGQYIVGVGNSVGVAMTPDTGGGWNERQEVESSSISPINVHDKVTSGAQNPATTIGSSGDWVAAIVSFVSAAKILVASRGNYNLQGFGTVPDNSGKPATIGQFDVDLRPEAWFGDEIVTP